MRHRDDIKTIDKNLAEYVLRLGVAGGISGSAAKTLIAPLDRIKILFQTSNPEFRQYRGLFVGMVRAGRKIVRADGVCGLFQGHSVTLLRIFPYAAIKFVAYEQIRGLLIPTDAHETHARRFLAGLLLGIASVVCTYPLDLVRVRLAFETRLLAHAAVHPHHSQFVAHKRGRLWAIVRAVYTEHPPPRALDPRWLRFMRRHVPAPVAALSNFYRGFGPTMLGMVPYAGVSFLTHDIIHDVFRLRVLAPHCVLPQARPTTRVVRTRNGSENVNTRDLRAPLTAPAQLVAGGAAGMLSQTLAYPFEVIRRRMQVGGAVDHGGFLLFSTTVRLIFAEGGVRGFFVGLTIGYLKVIPMLACSFFVYERSKKLLGI